MILFLKHEYILDTALCYTKYYNLNTFMYFLKVYSISLIFFAESSPECPHPSQLPGASGAKLKIHYSLCIMGD